jgi:biofilm PGA synthesis N-glycosyltransferase PgaC
METLWWILLFIVFYAYLGYGILLMFLVKVKSAFTAAPSFNKNFLPPVTLVVPAYNEAGIIAQKAQNSLKLDYPKDRFRILFITDGSTDNTADVLRSIDGVEVTHNDRRAGKSAAENRAMTLVDTPIVVFCDANTMLNPEAIRELVKFYEDPKVGGVAGEKRVITKESDNAGAGEGFYWKYESKLKKWDSELYTVVGAAGELISFRSELMTDLEEDTILDDFMQSLRICEKGYTVKYEPAAVAMETASETVGEELKRKIRIAAGGWQSMSRLTRLLNPFRNPLLTFQYVSHRVLRWSVAAFALPLILLLNVFLVMNATHWIYEVALAFQALFYGLSLIGWILENRQLKIKVFFIPYYFCMMNYAVFAGFFRWTKGSQKATWEKARRAVV